MIQWQTTAFRVELEEGVTQFNILKSAVRHEQLQPKHHVSCAESKIVLSAFFLDILYNLRFL